MYVNEIVNQMIFGVANIKKHVEYEWEKMANSTD